MLAVRAYTPADWAAIAAVHDAARRQELCLAELDAAFLPLEIAAPREGLLDYPGLFVALWAQRVVGFAACDEEELAWLYVDPAYMRRGVGRALVAHALRQFPTIESVEVLCGNSPALALYESMGFAREKVVHGRMPGNEDFAVQVHVLHRDSAK